MISESEKNSSFSLKTRFSCLAWSIRSLMWLVRIYDEKMLFETNFLLMLCTSRIYSTVVIMNWISLALCVSFFLCFYWELCLIENRTSDWLTYCFTC